MTTESILKQDNLQRIGEPAFQWAVDGNATFTVEKGEVVVLDGGDYAVWMSLPAKKACEVRFEQVGEGWSKGRWTLTMPAEMVEDTLNGGVITDIGGWNIWVGKKTPSMKFSTFFAKARKIEHIGNGYGDGSFPCNTQVHGDVGYLHMNQRQPLDYRDVAQRALDAWFEANAKPGRIAGTLDVENLPEDLIAATWHTKPRPHTGFIGWPFRQNCFFPNAKLGTTTTRDLYYINMDAEPVFFDSSTHLRAQFLPVRYWTWRKPDGSKVAVIERFNEVQFEQVSAALRELPKQEVQPLAHYLQRSHHGMNKEFAQGHFLELERSNGRVAGMTA